MKIILFSLLILLSSCANYVSQFHRQIDHGDKMANRSEREKNADRFAHFRNEKRQYAEKDRRPIKNPQTLGAGGMRPQVKREYRQQRYTNDDFTDQDSQGSLWANQGNTSALFTYQNDKHTGDMVIINVLENLRNQISAELKRMFPDRVMKQEPNAKPSEGGPAPTAPAAPPAAASAEPEHDLKVYDKVSGTVTEELSKDYVVLRGRKEVIYKKEKRSIEIQALVSRKDILENDYVNSDKLLETQVSILRDH